MAVINDLVIAEARLWLGTPYLHQSCKRGIGCDCIGLVRGVYGAIYGEVPPVPPYTGDWGDSDKNEWLMQSALEYLDPVDEGQPGDVVAVRWRDGTVAKHCMILSYDNKAIHAYQRQPVNEFHLSDWWRRRIVAAFRFREI
jgi:NlpC/P60 family putative phage cell wall peptidase